MASVKAFGILLLIWIVGGLASLLLAYFWQLSSIVEAGFSYVPTSFIVVALAFILGGVWLLNTRLKAPVRYESFLWIFLIWAAFLCFSEIYYHYVQMVQMCGILERKAIAENIHEYFTSPLKRDCDVYGTLSVMDEAARYILSTQLLLALLAAALAHVFGMVALRLGRIISDAQSKNVLIVSSFGFVGILLVFNFVNSLLANGAMLAALKIINIGGVFLISFGQIGKWLGYYGSISMMVLLAIMVLMTWIVVFRGWRGYFLEKRGE